MRLAILERRQRLAQKAILQTLRAGGLQMLDVVKTCMYRPEYFGMPFCDLAHHIMCGQSEWTRAERELFGAYVSRLNQCSY